MPRDGSGNYTLPSGNPVVTNTIISSNGWANPTLSDIASAITQSLSRDGQTTPTADLTMGNFKLRNLAAAIARTDAVNAAQVQDSALTTLASVGGGANVITASTAPAITAYTAGQAFSFVAGATNTTNAVTLNLNALGAKAVMKSSSSGLVQLSPGDIQSGQEVQVIYDGTQFQMVSPAAPSVSPYGTNKLVNGNFDNWQRGTSFSNAANAAASYTADSWQVFRQGFVGGYTASQAGTVPTNSQRAMLIQRTAGDTNTSPIFLAQSFETRDIIKWQGKTLTMGFLVLANGAFVGANIVPAVNFGTGTDGSVAGGFTGTFGGVSTTVAMTGAFALVTLTFTVPVNATQMGVNAAVNPSSTPAGASDFYIISQFQVNEGTWLPFERRSLQDEVTRSKRYYNVIFPVLQGYGSAGQVSGHSLTFPDMRTNPTVTLVSPSLTNCSSPNAVNILGNNTLQIVATVTALGAFIISNGASGVILNASL